MCGRAGLASLARGTRSRDWCPPITGHPADECPMWQLSGPEFVQETVEKVGSLMNATHNVVSVCVLVMSQIAGVRCWGGK
jgi:hypothetical protein